MIPALQQAVASWTLLQRNMGAAKAGKVSRSRRSAASPIGGEYLLIADPTATISLPRERYSRRSTYG
jgi:hypothetical protein